MLVLTGWWYVNICGWMDVNGDYMVLLTNLSATPGIQSGKLNCLCRIRTHGKILRVMSGDVHEIIRKNEDWTGKKMCDWFKENIVGHRTPQSGSLGNEINDNDYLGVLKCSLQNGGMYIMLIIKILKTGLKDKLYSDVYGTLVMQLPVWFCKQDFAIGYWLPIKQVTGRVGVHIMPSWVKVWCSVKQVCLVGCKTRSLGCQQPELLHLTINNQQGTATFRPEVLNFLVFFF